MDNKTLLVLSHKEYSTLMLSLGISSSSMKSNKDDFPVDMHEAVDSLVNNLYKFNLNSESRVYQSKGIDITKEDSDG